MTARATPRPAPARRAAPPRPGQGAVLMALSLGTSCILPDYDIVIEDEKISNKAPVRIAEQTAMPTAADLACGDDGCPQPGADIAIPLPHFLDPNLKDAKGDQPYAFCSCPSGKFDSRALPAFTIYVEDRDENDDRDPSDSIYAALQLDLDPADPDPARTSAYPTYVDPDRRLDLADIDYEPLFRTNPHLRSLEIGDEDVRVDLCNRAQSTALPTGYHSVRVIVSDRAWFKQDGRTQPGVPDLAIGATFDTVTFVFHCEAPDNEVCQVSCKPPDDNVD